MIRLLFILLLFFSYAIGYCQKPVSGYIVSAYGDTAKGFLIKDDLYIDDGGFVFYDSLGNIANVKSKKWKAFGVFTEKSQYDFINIKTNIKRNDNFDFAQRILNGKISIYKSLFKNEIILGNYNPLSENYLNYLFPIKIKFDRFFIEEMYNNILTEFDFIWNKKNKIIMQELFVGCEAVLKKLDKKLNRKQIFSLFQEFNNNCY